MTSRSLRFTRRTAAMMLAASMVSMASCLTISDPGSGVAVFTVIGGNGQTIVINTVAPQPLTVRAIDDRTGGVPGVTVDWNIVSGTGALSASSTVTGDDGSTAITFTAGSQAGPVLVRATAEGLRVTFTIEVLSAPLP